MQETYNQRADSQVIIAAPTGLSSEEADKRLTVFGRNVLPKDRSKTILSLVLRQFASPLIYILIFAAIVSFAIGEVVDGGFIVLVLMINGTVGIVQEYIASRAIDRLLVQEARQSRVIRDGTIRSVDATMIVPGDVLLLEAGDYIAADLQWNEAINVEVDESVFSGEAMTVSKQLGDRSYAGTFVTRGRGSGTVYATGVESQLGMLSKSIGQTSIHDPPLVIRVKRFAQQIGILIGVGIAFVVLYGALAHYAVTDLFLMAVGLAVSAIPEGLPVAMSVALAVATRRMARRNVIIRRGAATESLGSCTVIATDKTGTLTENRVELISFTALEGERCCTHRWKDYLASEQLSSGTTHVRQLLTTGLLATDTGNRPPELITDPLDRAIVWRCHEAGLTDGILKSRWAPLEMKAFDATFRLSAVSHRNDSGALVCVKGAFEEVLSLCSPSKNSKKYQPHEIEESSRQLAIQGVRVLALAEKNCTSSDTIDACLSVGGFTFVGLLGFQDPLREGVCEAVAACKHARIHVVVITGDDPRTATAIAREAAILDASSDAVTTGAELTLAERRGGESAFDSVVKNSVVFARSSPAQKLAIVHSLVRQKHFVAVTGDGINDAPALRHAHVGVAMGLRGTDIAKEVADIVVADDNFASIVAGIHEGRVVYSNIRKVVFMLVSTGCGEVVLFILSIASGLPMPLTPAQLLWLNLITEGVQDIALAFEKSEGDELNRPPRDPKEQIFDSVMTRRVATSAVVMGLISFCLFYVEYVREQDVVYARSLVLTLFVVFENVQALHARSEYRSLLTLPVLSNPWLILGIIGAQILHLLALVYPDVFSALDVVLVHGDDWILIAASAFFVCLVIELDKWAVRRSSKKAAFKRSQC